MTGTRLAWDDERLAAAFATRAAAAPSTPPDLGLAVLARLARSPRPRSFPARRFAPALGAAAAIAIAVIVGVGQIARSTPAASVAPSVGPSSTDLGSLLGAPISIAQAVAVRDAGVDDREIVVTGFLGGALLRLPCPAPRASLNPTRLDCPESFAWLMQDPESLVSTASDGSGSIHGPIGPAIHPSFALVGQPVPGTVANGSASAETLTAIGHFDDRRAVLCDTDLIATCRDTFVVDRVVDRTDLSVPRTTVADDTPSAASSVDAVDSLVRRVAPGVAVLSNRAVGGGQLGTAEPALAADPSWSGRKVVWIVTALGQRGGVPIARTFLVNDGIEVVHEITAAGVVSVPGTSATPEPSPPGSGTIGVLQDLLDHPITVSNAIDHRDHHLDDTEIAIEGFAWGPTGPISCPMVRPGMPAALQCPQTFTWVAEQKPPTSSGPEFPVPVGPRISLVISSETIRLVSIYEPEAVHAIVLGHFDDHRAGSCAPDQVEACRRNFIVEALVDPDDRRVNLAVDGTINRPDPDVRPVATAEQALAFMGMSATDPRVLRVFAVRATALAEVEPQAASANTFAGVDIVWIARWVDLDTEGRPVLRTRITADHPLGFGLNWWFDVTPDGLASNLPRP